MCSIASALWVELPSPLRTDDATGPPTRRMPPTESGTAAVPVSDQDRALEYSIDMPPSELRAEELTGDLAIE